MIFSEFDNERPHQALDMKSPAEVYIPSTRPYRGLPELNYPVHDKTIEVSYCGCGCFCLHRKKITLGTVFAGQAVGIKKSKKGIWLVNFMNCDLGKVDLKERTLQPLDNPFGPKVLPLCHRCVLLPMCPGRTMRQMVPVVGLEPTA
jgi:hypothetical protein